MDPEHALRLPDISYELTSGPAQWRGTWRYDHKSKYVRDPSGRCIVFGYDQPEGGGYVRYASPLTRPTGLHPIGPLEWKLLHDNLIVPLGQHLARPAIFPVNQKRLDKWFTTSAE